MSKTAPLYPDDQLRAGVEGQVELEVVVGADGKVIDVRVLRATNESFANAAVEATRKWTYAAPRLGSGPVCLVTSATVEFKLAGATDWRAACPAIVDVKEFTARGGKMTRVKGAPMRYPMTRLRANDEGVVLLRVVISTEGVVVNVEVVRSSHPDFEPFAVRAIYQWRYSKPTLDGKPVCVQAENEVSFHLR